MAIEPGTLLEGRDAIVTGGAAGIGGAISEAFLAHGAAVLAVDVDEQALARLRERAGDADLRTLGLDVTAPEAAEEIAAALPDVDVLINNVGHFLRPPTAFAAEDAPAWDAQRTVNLDHVLALTRAVLPGMIERGRGGSIVNLTTVEAFRGIPGHAVYSAYKAAVVAFGRSLALEVGEHGIRVNDIAPDVVETPQLPYTDWVEESERTKAAGGWYPRDEGGWTNRPLSP